jgi:hypothetical protein
MRLNRVRPLSLEGTREVLEEMSRPPEDTPERRRTLDLAREMEAARARQGMQQKSPANPPQTAEGKV